MSAITALHHSTTDADAIASLQKTFDAHRQAFLEHPFPDLRERRTHLYALADALIGKGYLELGDDGGGTTRRGEKFLQRWGIDLAGALAQRRSFCRPCLDWSERRPHIAGSLGARVADRCLELDWVRRQKDSRALTITRRGTEGFRDLLGIRLAGPGEA